MKRLGADRLTSSADSERTLDRSRRRAGVLRPAACTRLAPSHPGVPLDVTRTLVSGQTSTERADDE
jgi:hypothetical protein